MRTRTVSNSNGRPRICARRNALFPADILEAPVLRMLAKKRGPDHEKNLNIAVGAFGLNPAGPSSELLLRKAMRIIDEEKVDVEYSKKTLRWLCKIVSEIMRDKEREDAADKLVKSLIRLAGNRAGLELKKHALVMAWEVVPHLEYDTRCETKNRLNQLRERLEKREVSKFPEIREAEKRAEDDETTSKSTVKAIDEIRKIGRKKITEEIERVAREEAARKKKVTVEVGEVPTTERVDLEEEIDLDDGLDASSGVIEPAPAPDPNEMEALQEKGRRPPPPLPSKAQQAEMNRRREAMKRIRNENLLEAAREGKVERIKELLGEGADVDAVDDSGNTPLMKAAEFGRFEAVKILVEGDEERGIEGADLYLLNQDGFDAFTYADLWKHKKIANYLRKKMNEQPQVTESQVEAIEDVRGTPKKKTRPPVEYSISQEKISIKINDEGGWKIPQICLDLGNEFSMEYNSRSEIFDEEGNLLTEERGFVIFKGKITPYWPVVRTGESKSFTFDTTLRISLRDLESDGIILEIEGEPERIRYITERLPSPGGIPVTTVTKKESRLMNHEEGGPFDAIDAEEREVTNIRRMPGPENDRDTLDVIDAADREVTNICRMPRPEKVMSESESIAALRLDELEKLEKARAAPVGREVIARLEAILPDRKAWLLEKGKELPPDLQPLDEIEIQGVTYLVFGQRVDGAKEFFWKRTLQHTPDSRRSGTFIGIAPDPGLEKGQTGRTLQGYNPPEDMEETTVQVDADTQEREPRYTHSGLLAMMDPGNEIPESQVNDLGTIELFNPSREGVPDDEATAVFRIKEEMPVAAGVESGMIAPEMLASDAKTRAFDIDVGKLNPRLREKLSGNVWAINLLKPKPADVRPFARVRMLGEVYILYDQELEGGLKMSLGMQHSYTPEEEKKGSMDSDASKMEALSGIRPKED